MIIALLFAFCITAVLTPIFVFANKKFGLMDDPRLHKHPGVIHTKPIPRGGGIPLFIGALLTGLFFLPQNTTTIAIFSAAFIALAIGIIDDYFNAKGKEISPYIRFFTNILVAVIVVAGGVSIKFITNPLGGIFYFQSPVSEIVTVLWLSWIMNMLNWSKGVDGQMPGIVAISASVIGVLSLGIISPVAANSIDATLAFLIAGSALGFLLFNFHPAKIFPGYGATSLYLLLGVASILSSAKLATAILVMGVPLVDFVFTIVRRIINKKSPFIGDKKHLHHILLKFGYSQRQIALFYWSISAILGIISFTLESKSKIFAIIMLIAITGGGLLFLHMISENTDEKTSF
jgi:UDP-GlcNAc:undecaprenyl-phosphate GlcNAc-1-phosphate transferase